MKKSFCALLVAMVMLVSLLQWSAFAQTESSDTSSTSGIDVVIVLDNTKSMRMNENNGNDTRYYRLDAAAMLIGMLDMDGSRVAVVPFGGEPYDGDDAIIGLTSVDNKENRTELINYIYGFKSKDLETDTNLGSALLYAMQILEERDDKQNAPMILLLTDGQNKIEGKREYKVWNWNSTDQKITTGQKQQIDTDYANKLTKQAQDAAQTLGYPVYVIALGENTKTDETPQFGVSLQDLTTASGLDKDDCKNITDPVELPKYFATMLARQIGSSLQVTATPEYEGTYTDKKSRKTYYQYKLNIPVPNKSVLETNVILPATKETYADTKTRKGIINSEISVQCGDATMSGEDGVTKQYHDDGEFVTIKIRKPSQSGIWTLNFKSVKKLEDTDVSFNILYNYNIKLQGSIARTDEEDGDFYKKDSLTLTAVFVDPDGNESTDKSLYEDHTGQEGYEDWMTIKASYVMYDSDEKEVCSDGMSVTGKGLGYQATIPIEKLGLSSGEYRVIITAEGAGLERQTELTFELKNHEPEKEITETTELHVNTPGQGNEETYTDIQQGEISLDSIVTDADGDSIKFTLKPKEGTTNGQIIKATLNDANNTIHYETVTVKKDGVTTQASGSAVYVLTYDDGDGGKGNLEISFNVVSDEEVRKSEYKPVLHIDSDDASAGEQEYTKKKNTDVTVKLQLQKKDGATFMGNADLSMQKYSLSVQDQNNNSIADNVEFTVEGDSLVFTANTGNTADVWTITATIEPFGSITATVNIPNANPPVVTGGDGKTYDVQCDSEGLPEFLRLLGGKNTEEDSAALTIDLDALFTDADGDALQIDEPELWAADGTTKLADAAQKITIESETSDDGKQIRRIKVSGETTSLFHFDYTVKVTVKATDGDGQTATYTRTLHVIDVKNRLYTYALIVLIVVVALIVLILLVHQACKPRFPQLQVEITEAPSIYANGDPVTLHPTKSAVCVNRLGVDSEMAAKHDIAQRQVQGIFVLPARSHTMVYVLCKTIEKKHSVTIGGRMLKVKKKYPWHADSEKLIICNDDGVGAIEMELKQQNTEESFDDGAFGGFDSNDFTQTPEQTSTHKKTKKAEKTKVNKKKDALPPDDDNLGF